MLMVKRFFRTIVEWPNFLRKLQWLCVKEYLGDRCGMTVLDLGAGPLQYSAELARRADITVIAVDLVLPFLCLERAGKYSLRPVQADAQQLPFSDNSIDRIVMSSLFHMVPSPERLLAECGRVLRRDGVMVVSVPNNYQFIPRLFQSAWGRFVLRLLALPEVYQDFVATLNTKFGVKGPQGYYSLLELERLLEGFDLRIDSHRYSPGWLGSLLWEVAVVLHLRLGNAPFHLLLLFYPLARLYDALVKSSIGSEHVIRVVRSQ